MFGKGSDVHDIWNPWHGCARISEGCDNCYMMSQDSVRGLDGTVVRRSKTGFRYPLARDRGGTYKIRPGEIIRVCMTSDFLLEDADPWRDEAWDIIHSRPDVRFFILTKRPERFHSCLPRDWGEGWDNVMLNVTCEDQRCADERIPILLATPARHKGVMCAPLIGAVDIDRYLGDGAGSRGSRIEQVICGGENYEGSRPCECAWVEGLSRQCRAHDVTFVFIETGTVFVRDGRRYVIKSRTLQMEQAYKSGLSYRGREIEWALRDPIGLPLPGECLHRPRYRPRCLRCGGRLICNGCADCGLCGSGSRDEMMGEGAAAPMEGDY